jgi:sigma-54-interacting transcriptional regulator
LAQSLLGDKRFMVVAEEMFPLEHAPLDDRDDHLGVQRETLAMTQEVRTDTLSSERKAVTQPPAPPGNVDDVERRADDIDPSRGGSPGVNLDDWLQAERELHGASRENASSFTARLTLLMAEDLRMVRTTRANVLLKGMDGVTDGILDTLRPDLSGPIATWRPGRYLLLPPAAWPGTMILHNVGALTLEEQRRLMVWLQEIAGGTRLVSTTSAPLLPLVEVGAFLDTLYYRLNTIYLEIPAAYQRVP